MANFGFSIDIKTFQTVQDLLTRGARIQAIKTLREGKVTPGLYTAKEVVDAIDRGNFTMNGWHENRRAIVILELDYTKNPTKHEPELEEVTCVECSRKATMVITHERRGNMFTNYYCPEHATILLNETAYDKYMSLVSVNLVNRENER